jgi:ABC-type glycerol-3-phosphate transport system substrate-binding protein
MVSVNPEWVMVRRQRMPDTNLDGYYMPNFGIHNAQSLIGGSFAIGANTKYPEVCWDFLRDYTSAEVLKITVADSHRGIPGRISIKDDMVKSINAVAHSSRFFDSIPDAKWITYNNYVPITTILGQYTESIYLGEAKAADALREFCVEAKEMIAKQ